MSNKCPFRKTIITISYIDHEGKEVNVPLMDSLYTKTETIFEDCIGEECMLYQYYRFGARCGMVNNG